MSVWTLGFDTVSSTVSAAILRDGEVMSTYSAAAATTHSTTLLVAIERLLESLSLRASDLELIAFCAGPGSFTGVRIGAATAKGLAAPFDTPCVGVSSLRAMAELFGRIRCAVCPALNARRGNVYTALYVSDGNGGITNLVPDELVAVSEVPSLVVRTLGQHSLEGLPVYVPGDTSDELVALAHDCGADNILLPPQAITSPSGIGAALAGLCLFNEAGARTELFLEQSQNPIYLRKSQAEREKEEKQNGSLKTGDSNTLPKGR